MNLNKEELIKAKPDLIFAHESQKNSAGKVLKSLKDKGVKVVYVKDAQSIDETYDTFKSIGQLTDREKQAKELVDETKHNVEKSLTPFLNIIRNKKCLWKYRLNQTFTLPEKIPSLTIC